jgi:hypothetical protein
MVYGCEERQELWNCGMPKLHSQLRILEAERPCEGKLRDDNYS